MSERQQARDILGDAWLESTLRDVRYGARSLRKSPGFTIVTIATLALVIGANTAIFSAFYGLVFRHLPYTNSEQLVMMWNSNRRTGLEHVNALWLRNYDMLAKNLDGAAIVSLDMTLYWSQVTKLWGTQQSIEQVACSSDFFHLLKVTPLLGRTFRPADDAEKAPNVAILSARFWKEHFGGSPNVIGKTLSLNRFGVRGDLTIIGVMPEYVEFPYPLVPRQPDFWVNQPIGDQAYFNPIVARLKSGVSLRAAETEMNTILQSLPRGTIGVHEGDTIQVVSLGSELIRDVRSMLWVLVAALGFVLLIGCANVSNLLLVRGFVREKEFALRTALGAQRTTLIRQLFIEALLLAVCGGFLGFVLSYWGLRGFVALLPPTLHVPRFEETAIDPSVLAITAAVSMMAALLFGMFPTMRLGRINLNNTLKSGAATGHSGGSVLRRPGSLLLVGEIALALVLLAGTALLTQSFGKLLSTNARFQPEHLLTMDVEVSLSSDAEEKLLNSEITQFTHTIAALPGVRLAAFANPFPFFDPFAEFQVVAGGGRIAQSRQPGEMLSVTPAFFEMLGYELQQGRSFSDNDTENSPRVAVINEEMARMFSPDINPIGLSLARKHTAGADDNYTIIGIVKEPPRFASGERAKPTAYDSLTQDQRSVPPPVVYGSNLLIRTQGDPRSIVSMLREIVPKSFVGLTSLSTIKTGDDLISESTARLRFTTMLVSVFSAVALLLALIGIYGLISYYTAQRTREIGIRMALGATPTSVLKLVLQEGMALILFGTAIGIAAAYAFGRGLASMLYGVHPGDATALLGSAVLFFAVASLAFYIPARRAMRVDPLVALRQE
jgi:putative ABC transport system permease protein